MPRYFISRTKLSPIFFNTSGARFDFHPTGNCSKLISKILSSGISRTARQYSVFGFTPCATLSSKASEEETDVYKILTPLEFHLPPYEYDPVPLRSLIKMHFEILKTFITNKHHAQCVLIHPATCLYQ